MLVLRRKYGEAILLPESDVEIRVVQIAHGSVRLGITAPGQTIVREEIYEPVTSAPAADAAGDQHGADAS